MCSLNPLFVNLVSGYVYLMLEIMSIIFLLITMVSSIHGVRRRIILLIYKTQYYSIYRHY
jgi:hypothetical protein